MHRRRDPVGEQLRLGVAQRERDREIHPWTRLQLPLERIAMQVDDPGQHVQPGRIEPPPANAARVDRGDYPVLDPQRRNGLAAAASSTRPPVMSIMAPL